MQCCGPEIYQLSLLDDARGVNTTILSAGGRENMARPGGATCLRAVIYPAWLWDHRDNLASCLSEPIFHEDEMTQRVS
jgi:hypothetical protein